MANMSYCRFENTARDMSDCVAATEELELPTGKSGSYHEMTSHEKQGVRSCALRAVELLRYIPLEILAEAGVDLGDLPDQEDIHEAGRLAEERDGGERKAA